MSTHCALAILRKGLWSLGSAPACASLALICAVHAALGGSILEVKQLSLHVLEIGRKGNILSRAKGCRDVLSPLSDVGDEEISLRW